MAPKIGDGKFPVDWENYDCYSKSVKDLPILVGKTPLCEKFFQRDKAKNFEKFTPSILQSKFKLGLVIDLTETKRFYNPKEFTDNGVLYYKMEQHSSNKELENYHVKLYLKTLDDFLHDPNMRGKVVFIHAICGFQRLGYLLCRYLTDKRGYTKKAALDAFYDCCFVSDVDGKFHKYLSELPYSPCHENDLKQKEEWWSDAVEIADVMEIADAVDEDVATQFSEMHVNKGKQLAPKASNSSALAPDQDFDCEPQITPTEPSIFVVSSGSDPGLSVRTKLPRNEEEATGSEAKKKRIEELE